MNRFLEIVKLCKADVNLTVNGHKSNYESVKDYFDTIKLCQSEFDIEKDIGQDVYDKMVELDTIYDFQFYPDTPTGFYVIYHYDLDVVLDKALEILKEEKIKELQEKLPEIFGTI